MSNCITGRLCKTKIYKYKKNNKYILKKVRAERKFIHPLEILRRWIQSSRCLPPHYTSHITSISHSGTFFDFSVSG